MKEELELTVGNDYTLDADMANTSTVTLVHIYGKYFVRVKASDTNEEWDVMRNRLSNTQQSSI